MRKGRNWKSRELYSRLLAPPTFLIRLDGRNFSRILEGFEKPYDFRFAKAMVETCVEVLREFNACFAFTFSDEVTFLVRDVFGCRLEKVNSIVASEFSSRLSLKLELPLSFDSRVIYAEPNEIADYLAWRQDEAWRNHLNGYAFYTLLKEMKDRRRVQEFLKGKKSKDLHDILHERGINPSKTPAWQRRGVIVHWKRVELEREFEGRVVRFERRRVVENWNPPLFGNEEGRKYLENILKEW